jgi:membrane protein implicated in regulation of membrane protease activity
MEASTLWWIVALGLVAAEMATGTFYLLMLALGAAVAALCAHAGLGATTQMVAGALAGGGATFALYAWRRQNPKPVGNSLNLDVGETVDVPAWDAQGRAQVQYRGAAWSARWAGQGTPQPGPHRITALHGNQLELDHA